MNECVVWTFLLIGSLDHTISPFQFPLF